MKLRYKSARLPSLAIAALLCSVAAPPATAASIVDTGAGPDNNDTTWGLTSGQYLAAEFTLGSDDTIRTIEAYIGGIVSQTVTVRIFTDGGDVPGSVLYSGSFDTAITAQGAAQWQGLAGLNWALSAGAYWIGFEGTASNAFAYSGYLVGAAPDPLGNEAFSVGGSSPYHGADDLDLSIRITDDMAAAAVPEPATWALMLVGFGAIGGALRRRPAVTRIRYA